MARYAMVIDLTRCVGCQTCTIKCKQENHTAPGVMWHRLYDYEVGSYPGVRRVFLPRPCMHCANAPCLKVCPTGATYRRPDGLVLVDYDRCIGCKYCVTACPYEARCYNEGNAGYFPEEGLTPFEELGKEMHQPGVVEKCTFCVHRIDQGRPPACVEVCPTKARAFGDLDDPASEVNVLLRSHTAFQLSPELGTKPSVWYLNRR